MKTRILVMTILMIATTVPAFGCSPAAAKQQPDPTQPVINYATGITTEGRLEPAHFVEVGLNASGFVDEVTSQEGDQVQAGQVIAHIKNNQAQSLGNAQANASLELSNAFQALRDAQKKLDDYGVPRNLVDMTPVQAAQTSLERLNAAREAFEPYKDMSHKLYRPTHAYAELPNYILSNYNNYEGQANEYKKQVDVTRRDYRKAVQWLELASAVESARAQINQAQRDLDELNDPSFTENTAGVRAALANAEVRAPFAGTITNLDLKVGEFVSAGQPAVTIADLSRWVVKTTNLIEIDVAHVTECDPATVTFDALPGVTLKGYVVSVAKNYSENLGNVVYEVTITLTNPNPALRWGMTAHVKFNP